MKTIIRILFSRIMDPTFFSGNLRKLHYTLILILALIGTTVSSANEEIWTVEILMNKLSEVNHAKLDFVETKQSIFLITNTIVEGTMEYRAPDYIEKNTFSPLIEHVVIDGDSMVIKKTIEAGKTDEVVQTQSYSVQSHPLLKAAVESIRAMLAGNFAMLTENYILKLTGAEDAWQLKLAPKSKEILEYIESIYLTGAGTKIKAVVTTQADGDESTMELDYQLLE